MCSNTRASMCITTCASMVLARVVIHVLARVLLHVLARVLLNVLARVIIHVHDYYSKTCVRVAGFKPVGAERRSGSIPPSGRHERRAFLLRTNLIQLSRCSLPGFQVSRLRKEKMQKFLLQVRLELTTPA